MGGYNEWMYYIHVYPTLQPTVSKKPARSSQSTSSLESSLPSPSRLKVRAPTRLVCGVVCGPTVWLVYSVWLLVYVCGVVCGVVGFLWKALEVLWGSTEALIMYPTSQVVEGLFVV